MSEEGKEIEDYAINDCIGLGHFWVNEVSRNPDMSIKSYKVICLFCDAESRPQEPDNE